MKHFLSFILSLYSLYAFSQSFTVTPILESGSKQSRINMVLLSDGYQANELDKFIADATSFSEALFSQSPYKEYKNFFNVYAIEVASLESGASHPGTATDVTEPSHPVKTVTNYFGSSFDYYGIHRLLVATNTSAIYNVLSNNFPTYDLAAIIVNSPHYGGSGGAFAVFSTNSASNEIGIHELGHSFVGLIDEYYAGDMYAREGINMTQQTDPSQVKWKNWMGENGTGIYNHCCGGASANWYKPHQNCKMQYLGSDFCSVCTQGTIEKIHSLTSTITSYLPDNTENITITDTIDFSVQTINPTPNTLVYRWSLNGTVLPYNTPTITLRTEDLKQQENQLQVTVIDNSTLLRIDNHQSIHASTVTWSIEKNTLSITDIAKNNMHIQIYPNPATDHIKVHMTDTYKQKYTLEVYDLSGKQVYRTTTTTHPSTTIPLKHLPRGTYILKCILEDKSNISRKIILQ